MKKKRKFPLDDPDDETTLCGVPMEGDTVFTVEEFDAWMDAIIASIQKEEADEREVKE